MSKILIFIDWFIPGYRAGGPTKSIVNLTAHLRDRFDLYVLTSDTDYCTNEPYHNIEPDRWLKYNGIHVCYLQKKTLSAGKMLEMARQAACPVWYVNGLYSRKFSILPLLLAKKLHPEKLIVAPRGMLSPQTFKSKNTIKRLFLLLMRHSGLYRNAIFQATSEAEVGHIRAQLGEKTATVEIGNLPFKVPDISSQTHIKQAGTVRLMSAARIAPEKNTLYALKRLQDCRAHVIYDLYGQIYNKEYWEQCQHVIASLPPNVEVRVHPAVASDQIYLKMLEADCFYMPSCGENFGHAIAESLLLGRPVIISDRTPWRNLEKAGVGWDIPLETPERFSEIIRKSAEMADEAWQEMSRRAIVFAGNALKVPTLIQQYLQLFGSIKDS